MPEKRRLAWVVLVRVILATTFLIATFILNLNEPGNFSQSTLPGLFRLIAATYLFSLFSLIILQSARQYRTIFTYSQIVWDLILISILILFTGGIASHFSFLYILSVATASLLLSRKEAIYTASLCSILYGTILDFQFYEKLEFFGLYRDYLHGPGYLLYNIFINTLVFILTALFTGYLAERLRASEDALQKKEIDYAELERLNSAIVYNLESGVVTLTDDGRIRVFNRMAEDLTGISQQAAYDKRLSDIFSHFASLPQPRGSVTKGYFMYTGATGDEMSLDYRFAPFLDTSGVHNGEILAFHDVTGLRQLEEQLKKADRLAALGELSARIAHEIRNPLASISGSAQLIAQRNGIEPSDQQLLFIILNETERLNKLITDFLAYARPVTPVKRKIVLGPFCKDIFAQLARDPRFDHLKLVNRVDDELIIEADRDQLQQVMLNLLINAAEAMSDGGAITVLSASSQEPPAGLRRNGFVTLSVEDNGVPINREHLLQIFEPFFTTKTTGSGLGLATVYRIIEAHGGTIQAESLASGNRFRIYIPSSDGNTETAAETDQE